MLSPDNFANSGREKSQACGALYEATSRRGQNAWYQREVKQAPVAVKIAANSTVNIKNKEDQASNDRR